MQLIHEYPVSSGFENSTYKSLNAFRFINAEAAIVPILDHVESDDSSPARDINFDPLVLPSGIASFNDPLLSSRSAVYSQSFTRREAEGKESSAVSAADTGK